jgi:hypothetical protein
MPDDAAVPERYQPEPRKCDDKAWLREQYWGDNLLNCAEIAEQCELCPSRVGHRLREMGIPARANNYTRNNAVSPFAGFYGPGENAPGGDSSGTEYDPNWTTDSRTQWEKRAARNPLVRSIQPRRETNAD